MIIYTCPECGHDLLDLVLTSNPPIPKKYCPACGWQWVGKPQREIRVPFNPEEPVISNANSTSDTVSQMLQKLNADPTIDNTITTLESTHTIAYDNPSCVGCSNNPANGGSGVCFCTLGQPKIT